MKFKHLSFALLFAGAFSLAACSDDAPIGSTEGTTPEVSEDDGLFMAVNFMPVNKDVSRSFTQDENSSNSGVEIGTDKENAVDRVLILITDTDDNFIAYSTIQKKQLAVSGNNTIYQATAKFNKTDISDYYGQIPSTQTGNPEVKIYVYANYEDNILGKIQDLSKANSPEEAKAIDWSNLTYKLKSKDDNVLWTDGLFLMSNVSMAVRNFPSSLDVWNLYTTESHPFDLSGMNNEGTDNEVDNLNNGRGVINIHRMAARFDFRDGSQLSKEDYPTCNGVENKPFTYAVMTSTDENGVTSNIIEAKIINMSLVNELNSEYYLGRVSANGTTSNISLLGAEKPWFQNESGLTTGTPGNYVVSPYSSLKNKALTSGFNDYFMYPFFGVTDAGAVQVATLGAGWFTTPVADIVNNKDEKYPKDGTGFYNRWRYVTENTLPGESSNQVNSWSTGVVFKAMIQAGDYFDNENVKDYWDLELKKTLNDTEKSGPILYYYAGKLYCGWEHLQYAALKAAGYDETKGDNQTLDVAATLYKAVFGDGATGMVKIKLNNGDDKTYAEYKQNEDGTYSTELATVDPSAPNTLWAAWDKQTATIGNAGWDAFRNAVVGKTFTIYLKYGDITLGSTAKPYFGYFMYYYYWNRHNDNGNNGVMGPMEFAVVRNNVYKLAVIRLNTLGHPRIPENDPDTPKPDTPDEKGDIYLTVSVQVIPWVVRFNNIEF